MSISKKDMLLLSAYMDGELNSAAKAKLEQRINESPELQQYLKEMINVKETLGNAKDAGSSPFFEEAVMYKISQQEEHSYTSQRSILAYGGIAASILGVILLLVISHINEQEKNMPAFTMLSGFNPVLASNSITNEDVFNFALYNRLPLNKQKAQFLELGSDEAGEEFIKIRQYDNDQLNENSLTNYYEAMNFNPKQMKQLDSILDLYAQMLRQRTLFQKDNKLALNTNIWHLNSALAADLMIFSKNANEDQFEKFVPSYTEAKKNTAIDSFKKNFQIEADDPFLILTIDTLFVKPFEMNISLLNESSDSLEKQIVRLKMHLKHNLTSYEAQDKGKPMLKNDTTLISNVFMDRDSNILYLRFPNAVIQLDLDDPDDLRLQLKELHRHMKYLNLEIKIDSMQFYTLDSLTQAKSENYYSVIDTMIYSFNKKFATKIGKKTAVTNSIPDTVTSRTSNAGKRSERYMDSITAQAEDKR